MKETIYWVDESPRIVKGDFRICQNEKIILAVMLFSTVISFTALFAYLS